ncbi:XRE family transcriptional regulator [Rhizobium sp. ERR 922]|uniref:XRE family transcriptional regulator n=2 Tax=Rhizobium/Agrobacterium group TaxID=227290 RepID=A0ABQ0Z869_9HYPH|nr:XRE family transcriptional regulator [Rhizobium sp. ERR 922]TWB90244.1 XRE family transcriptional regulator [Rhizobium sp. ERR 942]GES51497.1 XRE family transcriptional regulator [Rhizobium dioscoreae]GLU82949.1 XRE family transcriptional regulator [Rhizobium sp. NBRC 114257]
MSLALVIARQMQRGGVKLWLCNGDTRNMNMIGSPGKSGEDNEEKILTNPARLGGRLRLARQTRGLTLKALALAADCSESLLSKIENGKASPSLPMLHRLVGVLGTNIGWMFEEADGEEGIVFRSGTRPLIGLDPLRRGEGISLERIIPYSQGHLLQCNIHHIEAGGQSAGPIQHVGEEVGYVLAGEIELMVGERTFRLSIGDSFVFNSELPHWYRNVGADRASIFWVNTPATF